MKTAEIILPWPHKNLSPNARVHWRPLAEAKKKAKEAAFYIARADLPKIEAETLKVRYSFHPPQNRSYDTDNLVSRMKAAQDGIALAIGIDDSKFDLEKPVRGPVAPNGMVKVELMWSEGA